MKTNNKKIFYEITFVLGFIVLFIGIYFANKTLIGFTTPILIFLVFGLIAFLIEKEKYNAVYEYNGYFASLLHLTSSFGGIALFIFFTINFVFKSSHEEINEYEILEWNSSFGGKNQRNILHPDFTINLNKKRKIISFPKEYYRDRRKYKKIELRTSEGLLGFDILLEKKLK